MATHAPELEQPSATEIYLACACIRATWKPQQLASRNQYPNPPADIQRVTLPEYLRVALEGEER